VLGVIGVPEASFTCSREHGWNPGVFVCEIPDGDTNTTSGSNTGSDEVGIIRTLLNETSISGGKTAESDIHFSVGDLDAESGEG